MRRESKHVTTEKKCVNTKEDNMEGRDKKV